ncbi:hypothetical protein OAE19_09130 [Porticoccaceae bacterium]|nr:hypothetical protein [Porticoccaceae bacterium]
MRTVSWFSCGAASAVATKLAIASGEPITVAYCEVIEEHPDNSRFLKDCEKWFGQEIIILGNDKYQRSIYNVYESTRYLKGPSGARCTGELKKSVRQQFEEPTDRQVFGYTVEEQNRVDRFIDANNDVDIWPILIERGLTKNDCLAMLLNAGIELPAMYKLGYHNNNCIGCVKGEAGYWNKIRVDFPDVFERMAQMEEKLNRTVCKIEKTVDGKRTLERIPLRELPPEQGDYPSEINIQCGIFCHIAEDDYQ